MTKQSSQTNDSSLEEYLYQDGKMEMHVDSGFPSYLQTNLDVYLISKNYNSLYVFTHPDQKNSQLFNLASLISHNNVLTTRNDPYRNIYILEVKNLYQIRPENNKLYVKRYFLPKFIEELKKSKSHLEILFNMSFPMVD